MEPEKMNALAKNKKLIIGCVLVGLVLLCIIIFALFQVNNSPDKMLTRYFEMLNAGKDEEMYEMLDKDSQSMISKEDFIARNKNIYEGIGAKNITIDIKSVQKERISYMMAMDTDAGRLDNLSENAGYSKENIFSSYKIAWSQSMILPQLHTADSKINFLSEPAKRGSIYDRNGVLLAGEGVASSVGLVPGKMGPDKGADCIKIAGLLGETPEMVESMLRASWVTDDVFVPIKMISKSDTALQDELLKIPGIMIDDKMIRTYPLGAKASQLTGYIQNISPEELEAKKDQGYTESSMIGKTGLERLYEDRL
ncbi:MAG: NTF2-like N-terminal transpeptidase domain-containing protein, partial [Eubacterium sp.]